MGKQLSTTIKKNNNKVIPMALDANFFFERALRHLDRNDYPKALKYFWKTVDIEPNNPIHYCNLAGILSEIGRFTESNDLLLYVVEKLDSKLTECYYYIANNFAHLEELEMSFKYIHRYLDVAPNGEYVEEAKEMLSYISTELDDEILDINEEQKEIYILHYKAKGLLEEGKFYEASKKLKKMVTENPDFFPARNNLALAYFYLGNYINAIEQTKAVLEQEKTNIHALCNLAVFYQHLNENKEYKFIIDFLKKIFPYNREHLYKLATTFAILGEHEMAYIHFSKLIKHEELDPILLHYGAVAAFNTGNYKFSFKWWHKILKLDEDSPVVRFYLDVLELKENNFVLPIFSYQYELPFEHQINMLRHSPKQYQNDFTFRSLLWGLENGDIKTREQILLSLPYFKNVDIERLLRKFLLDNRNEIYLKNKALLALEEMGAKPPYKMAINGKVYDKERQTPDFNVWKEKWVEVLDLLEENMSQNYNLIELYDAKILWFDFISQTYPDIPQIKKVEGWTAAIEYLVAKMHQKPISIDELADSNNVTKQTIERNIKKFQEVLNINKKINKDYSIFQF